MEFTRDALYGEPEPPTWQDTMQVCLDGHVINDEVKAQPELCKAHCPDDGQPTITECPSCRGPIPGQIHYGGAPGMGKQKQAPQYCQHEGCGKSFPWTGKSKKPASLTAAAFLEKLFDRFDILVKQLRQRHGDRAAFDVDDEYDVQDLLHALLRLYFDDIRPEEWTPSYAGKSARMDFLLKTERLVIETKMARKGLTHSELGDELLVDIARYKAHPDCQTLWCFVYDPSGYVRNPRGVENDLTKSHDGLQVKVVIR